MGRRSDHSRSELEALMVEEGRRQLAEAGLSRLSAREVAKRAGYSVGTLYNVFGSFDGLVLAINARTLREWAGRLRARLAQAGEDRLGALVRGYFEFALSEPRLWAALYEHHMAEGRGAPDWYQAEAGALLEVVAGEIAAALPPASPAAAAAALARSLTAVVHGHCAFALHGVFDLLGGASPAEAALARVREAVEAARRTAGATA